MSDYYNIVPWFNSKEWLEVYDYIYSSSNKNAALKLLLIWKARCPSLPSGIESTLTLLEVLIQDENTIDNADNDQLLRLAYSSAIMRFVNHMLDTETSRGTSLYQAARNLGVPDWIIDLRHDTAHSNNLPSIEILREASVISLEWLEKNYWCKYKECIKDFTSGQIICQTQENSKIAAVMNFCISLSFCAQSKCKNLSDIPNSSMRESIINDATDLFGDHLNISNLKTVSIMSLVNLLNTNSKKLLKSNDAISEAVKSLLGEDSIFLSLEVLNFLGNNELHLRKKLCISYVQCFELLITFLHTNDMLLDFILNLIQISHKSDDSERSLLAALWTSEILKALIKSKHFLERMKRTSSMDLKSKKKHELKSLYHHWFPNEKATGLFLDMQKTVPAELMDLKFLQPIISTYNPYLKYFIKDLLNLVEPSLPKHVKESICKLAEVISCPEKFPATSSKIYTVDDLEASNQEINLSDVNRKENKLKFGVSNMQTDLKENSCNNISYGVFKLSIDDHSWSSCPIGLLPWQTM